MASPRTTAGAISRSPVSVAEVGDEGPTEEHQQPHGGQGTDQWDERADEQAEDGKDLEEPDPSVGGDAEADVFGAGPHGGDCGELGRAGCGESDDEQGGENRGGGHDSSNLQVMAK